MLTCNLGEFKGVRVRVTVTGVMVGEQLPIRIRIRVSCIFDL